jgi:hypothetical protein
MQHYYLIYILLFFQIIKFNFSILQVSTRRSIYNTQKTHSPETIISNSSTPTTFYTRHASLMFYTTDNFFKLHSHISLHLYVVSTFAMLLTKDIQIGFDRVQMRTARRSEVHTRLQRTPFPPSMIMRKKRTPDHLVTRVYVHNTRPWSMFVRISYVSATQHQLHKLRHADCCPTL